jgi:hypothetical protein
MIRVVIVMGRPKGEIRGGRILKDVWSICFLGRRDMHWLDIGVT